MKIEKCGNITLINGDCMEFMQSQNDKSFDLAIVDPPYGINRSGQRETFTKNVKHKRKFIEDRGWDNEIPGKDYFDNLFRVSENQVIFGGNYFVQYLKPTMGWIFWDKGQNLTMSDGELAYTSFDRALRRIIINRVELLKQKTFHPTEKPIKLYEWVLLHYAQPGQKILDTHGGSMSHAIAAHKLGFDLTIIEKDPVYYEQAKKRLIEFQRQQVLF
jgi:site-specific DNA-methyltransferase (adenine-specific)|nr:MAG TPA: adenine specific DNA methyltransferase [Caudoviricetes sp.]